MYIWVMDTRDKILDLGEELIRTRGYHAFSFKDISVPLGMKNAAVHYHFPSKSNLGLAIIDRTNDRFLSEIHQWSSLSKEKQLANFLKIYSRSYRQNKVCFMGALGPAYDTLPANMQEGLQKASHEIRSWLTSLLKDGLSEGVFEFTEKPGEKADLIISALLAGLIMGRVTGEPVVLSIIKNLKKQV